MIWPKIIWPRKANLLKASLEEIETGAMGITSSLKELSKKRTHKGEVETLVECAIWNRRIWAGLRMLHKQGILKGGEI